jgi:mannose-6-phosphate isomerase-like protein (cupin superfamily)
MRSAVTRLPGEGEKITGYFGRSFTIKAHAPETKGAYSLTEFTIPPGAPRSDHHVHEADEAWYVVEGELTVWIGGESFTASPGSFVLAPGGVPHSTANTGSTPAKYLVFFSPPGLEQYLVERARLVEAARPGSVSQGALDALVGKYGIRPTPS